MIRLLLITSCLILCNYLFAQKNNLANAIQIKCTGFAISKPLSELTNNTDYDDLETADKKEVEIRRQKPANVNKKALPTGQDLAAQTSNGQKSMSAPIANWQGLSGSGYPPDPSGAASANYYFQAVNTQYKVYTKTGGNVTGGGPFNLSALWAGSTDDGDPIVLYDKYADRWFMSQFNGNDKLLIAVSTSSNPLGAYYTYTFVPIAGTFPDYPKYSIWSDGYYFSSNTGAPFKIGALDRAKILTGNPAATMISLDVPVTPNNGFFCPLTADADGQLPPYGTPCPAFTQEDDTWSAGGTDQLHVFKIAIDWVTPANSSVLLDQTLPTTPFNESFTSTWDDIAQPGTTQKLDAIDGVLMYRAQYRRWTGYNSVVLCHAVIVDPTTKQTGLRWYELRQNTSTGIWSIYQQSTYSPDLHYRWMGSIAMDDNGSIGLAYAVSSSTVSPSLHYTGRNSSDPLGQMTYSETIAITGSGAQSGVNRFGDYSQTALDPDGITFWHTGEYLNAGNIRTRIYSFQIPLSTATSINDDLTKTDVILFQNENQINVKGLRLPNNEEMLLTLFSIDGKEICSQKIRPTNNSVDAVIPITDISKGTYLVRIGNERFQKVKKIIVN